MGRTLHYRVLNQDQLSDEHLETLLAVSQKFNSGAFANVWTCENFYLDPLAAHPDRERGHSWDTFNKRWDELREAGFSPLKLRRQLLAEGVAKLFTDDISGFTKVGGNEWNAFLVYAALLEISRRTPALVKLDDEGEFLLCAVLIKNGKVRPDKAAMEAELAYWEKQGFLKDNRFGCTEKAKLFRKLLKNPQRWLKPERLCRPVKREDFAGWPEYNAGEIMAGFRGEYYGLSDENPFDASMHALADIFRMLDGGDMKIEVTPKPQRGDQASD